MVPGPCRPKPFIIMKTRTFLLALLSLLIPAVSSAATTSDLVPTQCTIGDRLVFGPISSVGFIFDVGVSVTPEAKAYIKNGDKTIAEGCLSCSNYTGKKRTQGTVSVDFADELLLPKGEKYCVVIPQGSIFKEGASDVSNEEISVEFEVPSNLGQADPSVDEGSTVTEIDRIGFYFCTETAALEGNSITLLREGIPVRTYPCDVSWDWDLGYAGIDFGYRMKFENGVHYSLLLPKDAVSALHRSDITNEKAIVNFIGGYTEPVKPLTYSWCSLFDHHPSDKLNEVIFYYDQPVMLSENPEVQLCEAHEGKGTVVKEVVPTVRNENGQWLLVADFEGFPLAAETGYSVVIPEGTLITKDGDVVVNRRNVTSVGNTTGIEGVEVSTTSDHIYTLQGVRLQQPPKQGVYIQHGKKFVAK